MSSALGAFTIRIPTTHLGYRPFSSTRVPSTVVLLTLGLSVAFVAGCAGDAQTDVSSNALPQSAAHHATQVSKAEPQKGPELLSFDNQTGTLEYWPMQPGKNNNPIPITSGLGITSEYGMAADGGFLAIASHSPPEVVTYNLRTQVEMNLPDPYGPPLDLALAKADSIYALNASSVTAYPLDRSAFRKLTCQYINDAVAIAVDNEGDIYVNGYGPGSFMGVVEYPFPPRSRICVALNLNPELGVAAGIGVDPQTDNLIVLDDPGSCAGTTDGRMTVYSKPYGPKTGVVTSLSGTNCPGTFRLDAASQNVFVSDSTPSGVSLIEQLSYPGAQMEGTYSDSDPTGGFTTLPNTLPN